METIKRTHFEGVDAIKKVFTMELQNIPQLVILTLYTGVAEKDGKVHYNKGGLLLMGHHTVLRLKQK